MCGSVAVFLGPRAAFLGFLEESYKMQAHTHTHFHRTDPASCLPGSCSTDSLKLAEARSEEGGDRWGRKDKALGWLREESFPLMLTDRKRGQGGGFHVLPRAIGCHPGL